MFEWMDPFLWQLVIVPVLTIGVGVYAALKTNKIYIAPIVTFLFNALIEVVTMTTYYEWSMVSLSSWNLIFPVISFLIAYTFIEKRQTERQLSDRP
ncbi:hypothetical protein A6395_05115 [Exiguobacterium sp. SH31]|uniref:hypothetical protein n=1 Tax=unclassified Exiguobacterium TaxID=2644629 RepID=UPI0008C118F3|nr:MULTISPECIES: hypothetical protein [unclassified Exiguobacterium]OGX79724.1 hypothetical protein A6395_05115 [Exiguobacterium sp. SH31]TCI71221.1 hypothetical protein EVJ22_07980 [Exiguobacterium sp. SH0S7]